MSTTLYCSHGVETWKRPPSDRPGCPICRRLEDIEQAHLRRLGSGAPLVDDDVVSVPSGREPGESALEWARRRIESRRR